MINTLSFVNLKGCSRSIALEGLNLIVGSNSTGKTAIIDAVKLALLGYHPRLGKKPSLTWQLASPGVSIMTVKADAKEITWKKAPRGTISVAGADEESSVPSVMLDLQEWLALSGPGRIQYTLEHSGTVMEGCLEDVDRLLTFNPKVDARKLDRTDTIKFLRELTALAKTNRQTTAAELEVIQGVVNQDLVLDKEKPKNVDKELRAITLEIENIQNEELKARSRREAQEEAIARKSKEAATASGASSRLEFNQKELKGYQDRIAELTPKIQEAESANQDLAQSVSNSSLQLATQREEFRLKMETLSHAKSKLKCLSCGHDLSLEKVEQMETELSNLELSLLSLDVEHSEIAASADTTARNLRQLKTELQAASSGVYSCDKKIAIETASSTAAGGLIVEVDELRKSLTPLQSCDLTEKLAKKAELTQANREFIAWKGTEKQRAEATEAKAIKHEANERAKELQSAIKQTEEKLMEKVMGGMLQQANRLIEPVLGAKLSVNDGLFMLGNASLDTVSGSEEVCIFAGLQLALTSQLSDRVLIIDELGRLDDLRLGALLDTVDALIYDKTISQFIGVLPRESFTSELEINYIQCQKN